MNARAEWKKAWRKARIRDHWARCRDCGYSLEEYQQQFGDRLDVSGRCTKLELTAIILQEAPGDSLAWRVQFSWDIPF